MTPERAPVLIARCPEHGLHGCREECFVCGGPVERVAMIPVSDHEAEMELLRREHNLLARAVVEAWDAEDFWDAEDAVNALRSSGAALNGGER